MKKYGALIVIFTLCTIIHQATSLYLFWRYHWYFDFLLPKPKGLTIQSLETIHEVSIPHLITQLSFNFIIAHFLLIGRSTLKYAETFALGLLIFTLINILSDYLVFYTQTPVFKLISFMLYQLFLVLCLVTLFKSVKSNQAS